ncbi:MAG: site-specific integrase [Firmicutes bacterium]|nr:site-specific integrase [Bacillota bacterium]
MSKPFIKFKLLSEDEQNRLHKYLSEKSDCTSISLLTEMYTGLRIGELCALRWEDIDFENNVIGVNKSVQRLPDSTTGKTRVMVTSTKTSSSDRVIPISSFLKTKLKEVQKADNCYLLSGSEKIVEPRTLTNRFKAVLRAVGISNVNFHSLRHGFAIRSY